MLGSFFVWYNGFIYEIYKADITYLTFIIYILFIYRTIKLGILSYKLSLFSDSYTPSEYADHYTKTSEFANWFVRLGLIGTVIGFIYMLSGTFANIDTANTATMQKALMAMATGMGTALYTTAAGLICSLLLHIQLFIYKKCMNE